MKNIFKDPTYFLSNSHLRNISKHVLKITLRHLKKKKILRRPGRLLTYVMQVFSIPTGEIFVHVVSFVTISLEKATHCHKPEFLLLDHRKQKE